MALFTRKRLSICLALGLVAASALDRGTHSPTERTAHAAAPQTGPQSAAAPNAPSSVPADLDRSPVDLQLTSDERYLVTANQSSNSLSLVDVAAGRVVAEVPCGEHPTSLAMLPGGRRVLVACMYSGTVELYEIAAPLLTKPAGLKQVGTIDVGMHPAGLAVAPGGAKAYVSLSASAQVAELDLKKMELTKKIDVARWPRQMAISADGKRLAVSTSGDQTVSVVDLAAGKLDFQHRTGGGINIGQLEIDKAGKQVYFPWVIYRQFPITQGNIRLGWVLATRIARGLLAKNEYREAISLDVPGLAMSDPHGFAFTPNQEWMVCSAAGTHELLAYRLADQKFMSVGGPGDLGDPKVYRDPEKFFRVPLAGRPMNIRAAKDNKRIFVANYLGNSVQIVDLKKREVAKTISLGGPAEPSLARTGHAIFLDARRSLDQWYSCYSCHWEGGPNSTVMDTLNDGSDRTFKTVPSLANVARTAPWTWHGWQKDIHAAMRKSLQDTMLGPEPTDDDVAALVAYFDGVHAPPNPYAAAAAKDTGLATVVERGRAVFEGAKAGCARCHKGDHFTDGQIHDVGLGDAKDVYQGFNTPSLVGVYQRVRLLHDGRAKSLEEVLTGDHDPEKVTGKGTLTPEERGDLIEYLKTL
ncbi:MAG: beta-propeller fold lactonase family protein [Planctomycetia bacterium]|nr:beta-propeller fold lactonase family protein [Planctomycetia bacterium]